MIDLIEIDGTSLSEYLEPLTRMNVCLRSDEGIDNVMSDDDVRTRMAGFIAGTEYAVLVMKDDDALVGYAVLDKTKKPAYLRQLFVRGEYRGQGHGSRFLDMLMDRFRLDTIDIDVMVWNESAIGFYEKYGFAKRYIGMRYVKPDAKRTAE